MFKKVFPIVLIFVITCLFLSCVSCMKEPVSIEPTPTPAEKNPPDPDKTPESVVDEGEISQDKLPENWSLEETDILSGNEFEAVAEKIGTGVTGIEYYYLNYKGERVQVNYVYFDSSENARRGFEKLIEMVGKVNILAITGNSVFEFITLNDNLIEDLTELLFTEDTEFSKPSDFFGDYPEITEYILKEGDIPGLTLNKEFLALPSEVENFSQKFGTEVYGTLHQYFMTESAQIININYLSGKDEKSGQVIYDAMSSLVENPVLKKDAVVIEVFEQTGDTEEVKKAIVKHFEDAGFKQ